MSIPGIAEEITLDSGFAETANITPNKDKLKNVTLELMQANNLSKTQKHIRVFDHKTLYIKEKIGKQGRHILLDLSLLDENAVLVRNFNKATLIASIALGIFAYIAFYLQSNELVNVPSMHMYGATGLLGIISVACFVFTVKSYQNTIVFKTAQGKVPALSLFSKIPNKKVFNQFTKALVNNIELARSNSDDSKNNLMAAIVGEHRRMFEKGFLTQEQFDQAKKNILSGG